MGGLTLLSWAYLAFHAAHMPDMNLASDSVMTMRPWQAADFVLMFLMWAIMMAGMMLPSATPMTLLYAAVAAKAEKQGAQVGSTASFVSGYLAMWFGFSLVATYAQWGLQSAALLSPMMVTNSQILGACLLIIAGVYQLTPWKDVCLDHCRSPAHFLSHHWRPGVAGAFRLGVYHGAFCLGCCWALMGLLFVGGVMNLLWVASIAGFVFLEKVLPSGALAGRFAGGGMIVLGCIAFGSWLVNA